MKKVSLSILAMVFAATSLMANNTAAIKKASFKQATCNECKNGKCTKACKPECTKTSCC